MAEIAIWRVSYLVHSNVTVDGFGVHDRRSTSDMLWRCAQKSTYLIKLILYNGLLAIYRTATLKSLSSLFTSSGDARPHPGKKPGVSTAYWRNGEKVL